MALESDLGGRVATELGIGHSDGVLALRYYAGAVPWWGRDIGCCGGHVYCILYSVYSGVGWRPAELLGGVGGCQTENRLGLALVGLDRLSEIYGGCRIR